MGKSYQVESDILIVGAGPAGITAGLYLQKAGIPFTILEKAVYPRDKICGDALSGKSVEILKDLDPQWIPEIQNKLSADFIPSYGVTFAAPNTRFIEIPFRTRLEELNEAPGFVSKRILFDHYLLNKLAKEPGQVIQGATVTDIKKAPKGYEVSYRQNGAAYTAFCRLLIGAEGDRSMVARKLAGHQMEPAHYCAGLRSYWKGVEGFNSYNFIELHFLSDFIPGYFWIFPLPNGEANVGVGMLSSKVSQKKINLKKAMMDCIEKNPTIRDRFKNAEMVDGLKGWGLPLGSKKRPLSGDGWMLTGDAGSLIDPFSGEGIGNAMVTGKLSAEMAARALENERFDPKFLRTYDQEVYRKLWSELKLSHQMQRLGSYKTLLNLVINKANSSPTLRETITCMFDDLDMRSRLSNPLFYLKLMFN